MTFTANELRGLIKGQCLPGDIRMGEYIPEYLARKFSEMQQKLDAMSAENAALKCKNPIGYMSHGDVADVAAGNLGSIMPNDVFGGNPVYLSVETPTTDAYLNSVRAEGVEMFGNSNSCPDEFCFAVNDFAAQLRSGTHDTAYKAS